MTRGRADVNSSKRLVIAELILVIIGAFFYYYSQSSVSPPEYGNKSFRHFVWEGTKMMMMILLHSWRGNAQSKRKWLAPWPARLTTSSPRLAEIDYSTQMCEAFSTYPRTYDLLHAWTVFSDIIKKECSPEDLLIEMDRMLKPKGFIIVLDKHSVVEYIKRRL
ncbi:hypothetical protein RJT34_18868 [Clitoria ternatea]|uniref:Methyltransferase n=1 Tax=Clitoria ternatea TaxID=43366 RepID=A0AAN9IQC7_CLITE